jgi:hypothetical protein
VVSVPGYRSRGPGFDSRLRSRKQKLTAVGIRCADHATSSIRKKLALTSPTSGGRSVGIVRLRTKSTEFVFFFCFERYTPIWNTRPQFLSDFTYLILLIIINLHDVKFKISCADINKLLQVNHTTYTRIILQTQQMSFFGQSAYRK